MQKFWTKLALVLALLILAYMASSPPAKKLRLGKDLRGGVSLTYSVEVRPGDDSRQVLSSVIDVLKNRVDPNGIFEIAMVPQGRDRIEITMPLPGEDVKKQKRLFEEALSALDASRIPPERIDRALSMDADARNQELERLAGGDASKLAALNELAAAADKAAHQRQSYDEAEAAGAEADTLEQLAAQAAQAEIDFESARAKIASRALTSDEVRRALRLSDQERRLYDDKSGEQSVIPSPRSRALERLTEEYPDQKASLDEIVKQFKQYESIRTTLDDPADLERLLRASGVLSFRITVDPGTDPTEEARLRSELQEKGPRGARSPSMGWYKVNKIENWYNNVAEMNRLLADPSGFFAGLRYIVEEYDGEYYMLCWDIRGSRLTPDDRNWKVSKAFQGVDQIGRPAINFEMDPRGAALLGELTEPHVRDHMAVLLDDEVYTAPTLNSRISRNGQIEGEFSQAELDYIIRVLNSGSLQNKLSPAPISRNAVGPDLGLDYLRQGLSAGLIALISISLFMVVYYFRCGVIAVVALACNALLLVGAMAAMSATFTLPGIAGIVLTFGMAVDSNVLIFERMREELRLGKDAKAAVRLGFSKAMSSIVDGNVTNLIVCIVLANVGTQEIKGFAITLGVGVVTTMFAALVISRLIFDLLLEFGLIKKIRMLPSAVPALERSLEPSINWLKLRWIFVVVSSCYVGLGLYMVFVKRGDIMDTEFRGGTQVTLQFKLNDATPDPDDRITMTRKEVEEKVTEIAEAAGPTSSLAALRVAQVMPLDPDETGITSDRFMIKSVVTDEQAVVTSIAKAFRDQIDSRPPLSFAGQDIDDVRLAPVHPLVHSGGLLGPDIGRPKYLDDVSHFSGGCAILLEHLEPKPTKWGLEARLASMREQPDFADTAGRDVEVRVLEGTPDAIQTAVILVLDPNILYLDGEQHWERDMAEREWKLTREALSRTTTLASVQSFSAAMAGKFRARAVVAVGLSLLLILIYVWVRFGSLRYSLGAVACLFHDCLTAIGLIAVAEVLCDWSVTSTLASRLGIMPFKIDLNLIAALLTIIGYSLNDTIIVMDRIREERGKMTYATDKMINTAINMTMSRTVITSGTTLLSILILYVFGGEGVRGFAYAMLIGVGVGTYSSIAVAAPMVWQRQHTESPKGPASLAPAPTT
ncbi:MAG: protein translocase subunit SecD [Phycisphaerales bacterium]|nr:protein translocase subunit SecD [Phycisphaerales bacterium]